MDENLGGSFSIIETIADISNSNPENGVEDLIGIPSTNANKPLTTVRFFNHNDFYTVHGDDASLATETVPGCNMIKYMGEEPKLSYNVLNKHLFERFVRELLLIKQYRVEVYIRSAPGRNNDWKVEFKGSPGNLTQFEDILFDNSGTSVVNSSVMAVNLVKNKILAIATVNTTEFKFSLSEFADNEFYTELEAFVAQINPKECLVPNGESPDLIALRTRLCRNGIMVVKIKRTDFTPNGIDQDLNRLLYFPEGQQKNCNTLSETNKKDALGSLQAVIKYLNLTGDDSNFNQFRIATQDVHRYVRLDSAAISALHLFPPPGTRGRGGFKSVFEVLDCCVTGQGRRLLEQWFRQPLRDINVISDRLEIVDVIVKDAEMRSTLRSSCLPKAPDMLLLSKKLSNKKASLQDCYKIYQIVDNIPGLLSILRKADNKCINSILVNPIKDFVSDMEKYQCMIEETLNMDLVDRGEFLVKPSFDKDLEELFEKKNKVEEKIQTIFQSAARDLGVDPGKTMKLECTERLGYFYKLTLKDEKILRGNKKYQIMEAVKAGVRFTDNRLKELNSDYMDICSNYEQLQKNLVKEIMEVAVGYSDTLRSLNMCIAQVDVLSAFAHAASSAPTAFVKPTILPEGSGVLRLVRARHPCIEKQDNISFIPNSIDLKQGETILNIVTGPNMGGKSTYMRSVALCVFLAHIGSFVPCQEAEISLVDCILTRVGSSDCEQKGLSTFMLEMVETGGIVRSATQNSLVIIDELGRGTSTYDGCSIAWSVAEYLVKEVKSFSLFATHFHEITSIATKYPEVQNLHVSAVVTKDTLTPLYQVRKGPCDKSYGIHCARIARFPLDVLKQAEEYQRELEFASGMKYINDYEFSLKRKLIEDGDVVVSDTLKKIKKIDFNSLSDEELLNQLQELREESLATGNLFLKGLLENVV
ncbi:putative component of the post-replicative DNA mismatch repair system (MMR) [Trypoxylus dichotomus]